MVKEIPEVVSHVAQTFGGIAPVIGERTLARRFGPALGNAEFSWEVGAATVIDAHCAGHETVPDLRRQSAAADLT